MEKEKKVGLIYDERMCKHYTPDGEDHPEKPDRIISIWQKLESAGVTQRCVVMSGKEVEDKHVELVHSKKHVHLIKNVSSKAYNNSTRNKIAANLNSIYLNEGSSEAAYVAAGSVVEASEKVATGEFRSAVAIVRPPGHHAEPDEAMGFCLYNNVAIAASYLLNQRPELGVKKILIVDWDVHHGNGTQKMFWKDPRVLYFSVHRFDFGTFYPSGDYGSHTMVGEGLGAGYNINVPWEHGRVGDADYLAVWEHILIPVARSFKPDMILISGGFDAAVGDPLGGCRITPKGYYVMMNKLMEFAQGKIMMALEGGYNLDSIAESMLACVKALLEDKPIVGFSEVHPFESTWRVIQAVREELSVFWPTLADELLKDLVVTNEITAPLEVILVIQIHQIYRLNVLLWEGQLRVGEGFEHGKHEISSSDSDAEGVNSQSVQSGASHEVCQVDEVQNVIQDLSMLKVNGATHNRVVDESVLWRSVLSKVDIWYASFGSNMWKPRLLCYIEGGKVDGMQRSCCGSMDRSPPKSVMWKIAPHRLFFGRSHTHQWGTGGVAFLHPQSSKDSTAYTCLYKITLEQFNDILLQENCQHVSVSSPLFDLNTLDSAIRNKFIPLEALKDGWYSNVLYLGTEDNLPVLTMTCPLSDLESYSTGKLPLAAPPKSYMDTLVKGLVEGKQLSSEEAIAYINDASARLL
ncbi:hypothetical protein IFM89_008139 [Coptis chinensis]|uniref:histone deacetylase n=1 Tax=Coptis chinensis TaxID=261450 RepID=A0A835IV85_9MAGN|nr:hypothetical protein IFM89_008139 [Coptis chinensis]